MIDRAAACLLLAVLGIIAVLCPGCAAVLAAGGVGAGVTWHQNAMRSTVDAQPQQVIAATEQVFSDMNIAASPARHIDAGESRISGTTEAGTAVRVRAQPECDHRSRLIVRVGLANRQQSLQLHNRIIDKLGLLPVQDHQPPAAVR